MSNSVKGALIVGAAILLGCFLFGGLYSSGRLPAGIGMFVVNRFTGAVKICGGGFCRDQIRGRSANPCDQFDADPKACPASPNALAIPPANAPAGDAAPPLRFGQNDVDAAAAPQLRFGQNDVAPAPLQTPTWGLADGAVAKARDSFADIVPPSRAARTDPRAPPVRK